jgi:hypothetical protein
MPPLRHRDTRPVGVSFARPARSQPPEKAQHVRLVARAERGQLEGDAPDGAAGPARGEAGKEQERAPVDVVDLPHVEGGRFRALNSKGCEWYALLLTGEVTRLGARGGDGPCRRGR